MALDFEETLDDPTVDESQDDWQGGANEYVTPTRLLPNQCGRLVNCVLADTGRPKLRWGADALGGAALTAARIDLLDYFDTPTLEYVYAAVAAGLRRWDGASWVNLAGYPFGGNSVQDMEQLNNLLYLTDAQGQWRTHNGSDPAGFSAALGAGVNDPPVGASILCAHTNRMFAAGTIGGVYDSLHASILGSAGAGDWNSATWSLRVGQGEGDPIKALARFTGFWLAVGKEGSISLVNADPRAASAAAWEVKHLSGAGGVVGKKAMAAVGNSSLFVVGPDRSLREIMPTNARDTPFELLPPASEPAQPYFDRINWAQQAVIQLHKYGRWLVMACPLDGASDNNTVLVWDLRFRVPGPVAGVSFPAFLGRWSGWEATAFCTSRFAGVEKFLIGDTDGRVNQWKDMADESLAATYLDNSEAIPATIRPASWDFGTQRNPKDADALEVEFIDSEAVATVKLYLDGVEERSWDIETALVSNQLPVNLPFDLAVAGPKLATRNSGGLPLFKEAYIEVTTTGGRIEMRRASMSAFVRAARRETA